MGNIPLMRPKLPDAEALAPFLRQIDAKNIYTNFGPLYGQFVEELCSLQRSRFNRTVYGTCVANATVGLELALSALGLQYGDRVGIPAFTFPATATAVRRCGFTPVALDVERESWRLTPAIAEAALSRTPLKAVMPVSPFGMAINARTWSEWSQATRIPVIVDAAASFGSQETYTGLLVVFSLHATKSLSSCEGGLILSEDQNLIKTLQNMSNFGFQEAQPRFGTNAKLSEYHAAIGLAHLKVWESEASNRRNIFEYYVNTFIEGLNKNTIHVIFGKCFAPTSFILKFNEASQRRMAEEACLKSGIQTRRWYTPLIQNVAFLSGVEVPLATEVADDLEQTILGLPFFLDITEDEIQRIADIVSPYL